MELSGVEAAGHAGAFTPREFDPSTGIRHPRDALASLKRLRERALPAPAVDARLTASSA
nr:hypothetical protein [Paraburkholderia sp. BL8N3]